MSSKVACIAALLVKFVIAVLAAVILARKEFISVVCVAALALAKVWYAPIFACNEFISVVCVAALALAKV